MPKHFTVWTPCLVLFHRVWSCLIKFEGRQAFDQRLAYVASVSVGFGSKERDFLVFCPRCNSLLLNPTETLATQANQRRKTFLLFACLMGDVLFVWTTAYQTCLMRACVQRLLSGLYQLFHLCLIKHVLTVWPLTSTLACLVTKQRLMVFGRQKFIGVQALRRKAIKAYFLNKSETEKPNEF